MVPALRLAAPTIVAIWLVCGASPSAGSEQERLAAFQREVEIVWRTCCGGALTHAEYSHQYFRAYRHLARAHAVTLDIFFDAYEVFSTGLADRIDRGILTREDARVVQAQFRVGLEEERTRYRSQRQDPRALDVARVRLHDFVQRENERLQESVRAKALELERRRLREAAEQAAREKALEQEQQRAREAAKTEEIRRLEAEVARVPERVRELEQEKQLQQQREARQRDDDLLRLLLFQQAIQGQRGQQDSSLDAYTSAWQTGFWSSFWSNMFRPQTQCRTTYIGGYARTTCD